MQTRVCFNEFTMQLTYFQLILGCQMNKSDAERLASLLDTLGLKKTENEDEANLIAVQACSVRQSAIDRIHSRIHRWKKDQKERPADHPLITLLTGCVLPDDRALFKKQFDTFIETDDVVKKLPAILYEKFPTLKAQSRTLMVDVKKELTNDDFFALKPNYSSPFQAYIPIQAGCNNFCTFCAVPYTKGRERYRPNTEIVHEIEKQTTADAAAEILRKNNLTRVFDKIHEDIIKKATQLVNGKIKILTIILSLNGEILGTFNRRFLRVFK